MTRDLKNRSLALIAVVGLAAAFAAFLLSSALEAEPRPQTSTPAAPATPPAATTRRGHAGDPMPIISRDVPAFASDDCGGSYAAEDANDADYATHWRACEPISPSTPAWLAYDLSALPAARRGRVVVGWFNDPITSQYDHDVTKSPAYNNVGAYTLEVNAAPGGGGAPADGWKAEAAASGNTLHSRQHVIDMTGANWLRLRVTASDGSPQNEGVGVNMDVHDAAGGVTDDWMFYGDSITQDGMSHDPRRTSSGTTFGTFAQLVGSAKPGHFPLFEDGGIGGLRSGDGASRIEQWLPLFPGRFVALAYGTNDANAGPGDPTIADAFHDNMQRMIDAVLAAGKRPIVPRVPWGRTASLQANVPVLNLEISRLLDEYPKALAGPDLYALYRDHQSWIGPDGIHPTREDGYAALRRAWADWAVANAYSR